MSKIYYTNGDEFLKHDVNFYVNTVKTEHFDTKIEIKIIEPIFEYLVIYKNKHEEFYFSAGHYLDKDDFVKNADSIKFIELYQPSKRERNQ